MTQPLHALPRLAALALAACLAAGTAHSQTPTGTVAAPSATDPRYTWDLSPLFKDDAAWEAERQALLAELPKLRALEKGFGSNAAGLRKALDQISAVSQRMRRLGVYANAQASTDNRNARNQERAAQSRSLWGQYGAAVAWVDTGIAALGAAKVERFVRAEPGLARHAVRLQETLRQAKHRLHPEAEKTLAALSPVLNAQSNTRQLLVTVDMEWPTLTIDGKPQRLDSTAYTRLRAHPDRAVRKQVFDSFFASYGRIENTLGSTLAQRVEAGVVDARLRGYPSAVAASLPTTPFLKASTAPWWPRPTPACPRCTAT